MTVRDLLKQLQSLTLAQLDLLVLVEGNDDELHSAGRLTKCSNGPEHAIVITRIPSIEGIDFEDDLREAGQALQSQHCVLHQSNGAARVIGPFETEAAADEWVNAHASRHEVTAIYTGMKMTAPEHVNQYDQGNCGPNAEISDRTCEGSYLRTE